jgi:hypothetical protein
VKNNRASAGELKKEFFGCFHIHQNYAHAGFDLLLYPADSQASALSGGLNLADLFHTLYHQVL